MAGKLRYMQTVKAQREYDKYFSNLPKGERYYAGENYDLRFSKQEVQDVVHLWGKGASIFEILKHLQGYNPLRTGSELVVLLLDLADNDMIQPRINGIFGGVERDQLECNERIGVSTPTVCR
jgi:hypothetical protein